MTRVLFRGEWFAGELLYSYDYPYKVVHDWLVYDTVRLPQRVGLLIDGVATHFTMPTEVRGEK